MRAVLASGLKANLTVIIHGGTYLPTSLSFDDRDSAPEGYKATYRNYPKEEPMLVGGHPVAGWEQVSGSIYRAKVGPDWKFYTLFENGVRPTMARTPNDTFLKVAAAVSGSPTTQFV